MQKEKNVSWKYFGQILVGHANLFLIVRPFWCFMQVSCRTAGTLTDVVVDTQRRKHLAYLMADHGAIVNPESARNLPKQVVCISVGNCLCKWRLFWRAKLSNKIFYSSTLFFSIFDLA